MGPFEVVPFEENCPNSNDKLVLYTGVLVGVLYVHMCTYFGKVGVLLPFIRHVSRRQNAEGLTQHTSILQFQEPRVYDLIGETTQHLQLMHLQDNRG